MSKPVYRVFEEQPACPHCKCGAEYTVVYDDENGEECGIGTSWGGPADDDSALESAEQMADDLNNAYEDGRKSKETV